MLYILNFLLYILYKSKLLYFYVLKCCMTLTYSARIETLIISRKNDHVWFNSHVIDVFNHPLFEELFLICS